MGRKTYQVAVRSGMPAYPGVKNYVFSRTLQPEAESPVEIVAEDAATFVARLKEEPGGGICVMGGGEIGQALLSAAVIDEIGVNVHPVLLGQGIPLFHPLQQQIDLELIETERFENACVYLLHSVRR